MFITDLSESQECSYDLRDETQLLLDGDTLIINFSVAILSVLIIVIVIYLLFFSYQCSFIF